MSKNKIGSTISSSDLIDAKLEEHRMCGSKQCPGCGQELERRPDWLGLPAGVKFDPTDQELIEHLEAKVASELSKSHPLIDEFIPTIEGEDGICYTHPEKLPGVTKDGLSRHFFHRPSKAYTTGTRKRRKIQAECDLQGGETRWHKTGKTRPVMVNGKQKGCKKILVLYTNFGKHRKPEKTNWVMHQYHLGQLEEEKEGELVVSKIFYQTQPRQCNTSSSSEIRSGPAGPAGEASSDHRRPESASGASSSKEVISNNMDDELGGHAIPAVFVNAMSMHQMKSDNFSFAPFRKSFDEVGMGDASKPRDQGSSGTCEEHEEHEQQQRRHHVTHEQQPRHAVSNAAFHVIRPSSSISSIISPPPLQTSVVLADPYDHHAPRPLLPNDKFEQKQQKLAERLGGTSGLEELIMGYTSTSVDMKEWQMLPQTGRNNISTQMLLQDTAAAFRIDALPIFTSFRRKDEQPS